MLQSGWFVGLVGVCVAAAFGPAPASASLTAVPPLQMAVIATGLNNPRGMTFDAHGVLYVAEAGLGSGDPLHGAGVGYGPTGSITAIGSPDTSHPTQSRVAALLPSFGSDENGIRSLGPDDVSAWTSGGTSGLDTVVSATLPGTDLGKVLSIAPNGQTTALGDPGAFDLQWTTTNMTAPFAPPNQWPDTNPYGLTVSNGHTYVVDAGSNTLDEVLPNGTVQILAYLPNSAVSDVVPTCVVRGPDGALYIGALDLAGYVTKGPGTANVYRVDPQKTNPGDLNTVLNVATVWATGFTTITGCTFGPDGDFYATQMFAGDVVRVPFTHPATGRTTIGDGQLTLPDGVAVGSDGTVYVSNESDSTQAGQGEVVRFRDATAPEVAMTEPSTVTLSTHIPVAWTATDTQSGVASSEVAEVHAAWNGAFGSTFYWLPATTASSATFVGGYGNTYCFTVRARDHAGNLSAWTPQRCTSIPLQSTSLSYSTGWRTAASSAVFSGVYDWTSTHGAHLTRTSIQAKHIWLVATTCATCGTIQVRWNNVVIANVSLVTPATLHKRLLAVASFTSIRTGTLTITVTSTSGRSVTVEGLAIARF